MLQIKEFRDAHGVSQRELALLLGASVQQVKRSELSGAWPNSRLSDLYRKQKTLFYQEIPLSNPDDTPEPKQPDCVRKEFEELRDDCLFLIRKHERNLAQLATMYTQATRFYAVVMRFTASLTDADEAHLNGLTFLESLLLQKLKRSGPVEQLKISIRVKSLRKQIEYAEDILNGIL